jgi:hypothetical protein
MGASRIRGGILLLSVLFGFACGGSETDPGGPKVTAVKVVSGDNQTGFVGLTVGSPLTVRVTASNNTPVPGVTVNFQVTSGSATVTPSNSATDADGRAQTTLKLGSTPGNIQVTATVEGTGLTATFTAVAGSTTVSIACNSGAGTLPAVNSIQAGLASTGICLSGGTAFPGAEYTLIGFNSSTVPSATSVVEVTGRGINLQPLATTAPAFDAMIAASARLSAPTTGVGLRASFDAKLRAKARRVLTPLLPVARAARAPRRSTSGALLNSIPSTITVGQILKLNVNSDDPCDNANYHFGRVMAISSKAVVVSDTLNPPNGFTTAQYQSIGVTFDTLVDPLDRAAFGNPSDIDANGKVVIFYTRAVNELTPRGSQEYVGGLFYERDLFPITSTADLEACAGSNVGEMFYMLAPDPTGIVNGNRRDTALVRQTTIGTVAHEYQHLINAAHRIADGADFEEVWLNEGLSHIAEELLYYRATGQGPRQNINSTRIRQNQESVNAFNEYAGANFNRLEDFLSSAPNASPYADDDDLSTRGATWSMLRYLADHRGSADGDAWSRLVDAPTTGMASLRSIFGTDVLTQIRDWGTSFYTDDFTTGADARFLQPSWNVRSVYTSAFGISYPLKISPLSDGAKSTQNMQSGGVAVMRFSVSQNGQASIDWTATGGAPVSPAVTWTLVRTR